MAFSAAVFLDCYFGQTQQTAAFNARNEVVEAVMEGREGVFLAALEAEVGEGTGSESADVGIGRGEVFDVGVDGHAGEFLVVSTVDSEV